jgi:uncharacterized protein (DUF2141 family)
MSRPNPVVALLSLICLAAGVLLVLDSSTMPNAANDRASLESVSPLPGYTKPMQATALVNSDAVKTAAKASSEPQASDTVTDDSTRSVAIHVTGLKNQSSTLFVAVFDSAKGFPKPEHSRETSTVPVTTDSVDFSLSLPDLTTTGIAIFQDLNGDGKLTKNSFGLPIEPYGFSNNARSTFGPPSFSQSAFQVSERMPSMEITVR